MSSYVATGHVGLSVIVPTLQALGLDVIALPTVVLSNHKGQPHYAGDVVPATTLSDMLHAMAKNGDLDAVDGILTGYMPTAAHVVLAASAIDHVREISGSGATAAPSAKLCRYICDPVMGDWPTGLYVDAEVVAAIRDLLMPRADIITPNVFEAETLTGSARTITTPDAARDLASRLNDADVVITSVPSAKPGTLANVATSRAGLDGETRAFLAEVPRRPHAPHGTGDMFAAALSAALATEHAFEASVAFATAAVDHALQASVVPDGGDAHAHLRPHTFVTSFDVASWPTRPLSNPTGSAAP